MAYFCDETNTKNDPLFLSLGRKVLIQAISKSRLNRIIQINDLPGDTEESKFQSFLVYGILRLPLGEMGGSGNENQILEISNSLNAFIGDKYCFLEPFLTKPTASLALISGLSSGGFIFH